MLAEVHTFLFWAMAVNWIEEIRWVCTKSGCFMLVGKFCVFPVPWPVGSGLWPVALHELQMALLTTVGLELKPDSQYWCALIDYFVNVSVLDVHRLYNSSSQSLSSHYLLRSISTCFATADAAKFRAMIDWQLANAMYTVSEWQVSGRHVEIVVWKTLLSWFSQTV